MSDTPTKNKGDCRLLTALILRATDTGKNEPAGGLEGHDPYISWWPWMDRVQLDGGFTATELRDIARYMDHYAE